MDTALMPTYGSRQTILATNPGAPIDGRPALYDVPAQRRLTDDYPAFDAHRAFASSSSLPQQKAPESPTTNPARLCIFWHSLALSQASTHCKALQACALVEQQLAPAVCAAAPSSFLHWAKNSQQGRHTFDDLTARHNFLVVEKTRKSLQAFFATAGADAALQSPQQISLADPGSFQLVALFCLI
ncbi:hypothetical protein MKX08_006229 [Trichoderma sp. CBMAI-0020]|nr:hypothetical protein MKX08_006229 [Trichoderma sp. CBMAI-0020]